MEAACHIPAVASASAVQGVFPCVEEALVRDALVAVGQPVGASAGAQVETAHRASVAWASAADRRSSCLMPAAEDLVLLACLCLAVQCGKPS